MRMPIKLNRSFWPGILSKLLPSSDDPTVLLDSGVSGEAFSKAISVFKFGATFKTTKAFRFPKTIELLAKLDFDSPPVCIDVGASDGITSLHVINSIEYEKYYITDLNTECFHAQKKGRHYYYDGNGNCILIVSRLFVVYPDLQGAIFPFGNIVQRYFMSQADEQAPRQKIELINPGTRAAGKNITVAKHDVFSSWQHEKADMVIAANILNRCYFSDQELTIAVDHLKQAVVPGGRLVVVDNRDVEGGTLFRVSGKYVSVEAEIGDGTEIRDLILADGEVSKVA